MKTVIVALIFLLAACGKDEEAQPCAGTAYVGAWSLMGGSDVLNITAACRGTSSYCQSSFRFTPTNTNQVTLTVESTNANSGCPVVGQTTATYGMSNGNLQVAYPTGGINTYTRQ